jgi:uncharacterized protein (UPF0147 family)
MELDFSRRVAERIAMLRQEHQAGEEQLRALENRQRDLRSTLLRISGAIQVLEEMLEDARLNTAAATAADGAAGSPRA